MFLFFIFRSPIMGHYRDPTHARAKTPGQESYPTMSTINNSSRTLPSSGKTKKPRPKSLIMGSSDIAKMKRYKSVVTLKQSDFKSENQNQNSNSNSPMLATTPQREFYQRNYVQRASPTKSTSPTHEAMAKSQARSRKLSYRNSTLEEPFADLDDNQELEAVTRVEPPTRMISHHSSEYFSMSHSSDEYESEYA